MPCPLPLQFANPVYCVGDIDSLRNDLVTKFILQRNSEHSTFHSSLSDFELVDQPNCERPRLRTVGHDSFKNEERHSYP
ncbi:hypothetical protein O3G_MSEX012043 [Manduca sexta]|uniref:Uncharacterized protein n=1 Tax=Manduca sexta TaxID=7130 RepID=A0A921ZMR5_MANSE|nr:hypothetical protein O3G_MSEX012043 [Manduca sexta]